MSLREAIREGTLHLVGQEVKVLRVTLRVVGKQSLAPQSLTPQTCITKLGSGINLETTCTIVIHSPQLCLTSVSVVVIRELIALTNDACVAVLVVVVEVVLICNWIATHITLGKFINIHPEVATKQVLNLVVVLGTIYTSLHSRQKVVVSVEIVRDICCKVVVDLVGMTLLDHIVRAMTLCVWRGCAVLVRINHIIEVDTTCPNRACICCTLQVREDLIVARRGKDSIHGYARRTRTKGIKCLTKQSLLTKSLRVSANEVCEVILGENLRGIVRWQVAIVVWSWICAILPSHCRIAIETKAHRCSCGQTGLFVDVVVVVQHHDRLVRTANTGVAQLSILITYIRVVVVATKHIVSLLCRCLLCATLLRCSENHQREAMLLVDLLLGCCEVTIRVVIYAINIAITTLTSRNRSSKGPTIVELTCCIRNDSTESVHLITTRDACTEALTHLRCTSVDICRAGKTTHTIVGSGQTCCALLVTGCIVHTAPQRPRTIACQCVIEADTVEIYIGILRVVATNIEAHLAKTVRCDVVVQILRCREH